MDADRLVGRPRTENLPLLELDVVIGRLQQVGRDLLGLLGDLAGHHGGGRTPDRRRARPIGAQAVGRVVGVAVLDLDVGVGDAELLATIWANVVSWPWPWVFTPSFRMALPVGWTRSSAESIIFSPAMSYCLDGPAPTASVKCATPIPMRRPSSRAAACSSRKAS